MKPRLLMSYEVYVNTLNREISSLSNVVDTLDQLGNPLDNIDVFRELLDQRKCELSGAMNAYRFVNQ